VRRRTALCGTVHVNYMQIIRKYPNKMADDVAVVTIYTPSNQRQLFPGNTYTFLTSLNKQPIKLETYLFRRLNLWIGRHFVYSKCTVGLLLPPVRRNVLYKHNHKLRIS